jgi:Flp pilus assembly protein TadG
MPAFSIRRSPLRPANRQHGGAALELALLAPVLLLLSFGLAEYGRIVYSYNVMAKAVHAAARHLAVNDHLTSDPVRDAIRTQALNLALYGDLQAPTDQLETTLAPGLTAAMVRVCTIDNCSDHVAALGYRLVSVTIHGYRYPPMFSSLFSKMWLGSSLTFMPVMSTMRGRS